MKTTDQQIEAMIPEWVQLFSVLIPEITDDMRATDDSDDDEPCMLVTVGFTESKDGRGASWGYQTGDNSFTGGAYGHVYWSVIYLTRDTNPHDSAADAADQIADLVWQGKD